MQKEGMRKQKNNTREQSWEWEGKQLQKKRKFYYKRHKGARNRKE